FPMCDACRREYENPGDRRFHAEPTACADCGPHLWLTDAAGAVVWGDAIDIAAAALRHGAIVAVKGLGGFQLACDATDPVAVGLLRTRKRGPAKPLAVMVDDLAGARARSCTERGDAAASWLNATPGPFVLVRPADPSARATAFLCGLDEVG